MYKKDTVIALNQQNLTNQQISDQTGFSLKDIRQILTRYGFKSNRYLPVRENIELKQFIIGSMLGDGSLSKITTGKNSRISFGHCEKQYEYLTWKSNLLDRYSLSNNHIGKWVQKSDRYKSGECITFYLKSKAHPYFTILKSLFYPNGKKEILLDLVKEIDALGLAIWYMDDGGICTRSYQIACNGFTNNEHLFLIKILKDNFDINATVDKNGSIYIRTDSKQRFKELIEPYMIPCMLYKLRQS